MNRNELEKKMTDIKASIHRLQFQLSEMCMDERTSAAMIGLYKGLIKVNIEKFNTVKKSLSELEG